eukprot:Skav203964  [mRNA]  locus=scaffold94:114449:115857:- [translate_table: standard]
MFVTPCALAQVFPQRAVPPVLAMVRARLVILGLLGLATAQEVAVAIDDASEATLPAASDATGTLDRKSPSLIS